VHHVLAFRGEISHDSAFDCLPLDNPPIFGILNTHDSMRRRRGRGREGRGGRKGLGLGEEDERLTSLLLSSSPPSSSSCCLCGTTGHQWAWGPHGVTAQHLGESIEQSWLADSFALLLRDLTATCLLLSIVKSGPLVPRLLVFPSLPVLLPHDGKKSHTKREAPRSPQRGARAMPSTPKATLKLPLKPALAPFDCPAG